MGMLYNAVIAVSDSGKIGVMMDMDTAEAIRRAQKIGIPRNLITKPKSDEIFKLKLKRL